MPFTSGETVGPYQIVEQLGQGGMATVFKAYHAALDRYVALKVLHPAFQAEPSFLGRFQREAQIVAKLDHPNIVPVYDFAQHKGHPYLVMRYVEGETLKHRLQQCDILDWEQVWHITKAVGEALAYAHSQDVLHRDIKPSNVIIAPDEHIFLTDFGLARMAEAGESTLSRDIMVGTPQYISPEQAKGTTELDARADLYSLGVVLYEMMVGCAPYQADTPYAVIHDHIFSPLPLPRSINPDLSESAERFLLKALAKEPKERFQTAQQLLNALEVVVDTGKEPALDRTVVGVPAPVRAPRREQPAAVLTTAPEEEEQEGVLTVNVQISKADAIGTAQKALEGRLRKRERIEEHAPKVLLALWRVQAKVKRLIRQVDKYLYFDAYYGKLLNIESKEIRFTDIVDWKARKSSELDIEFIRRPMDQLTTASYVPRASKDQILETARDMFGVETVDAELVMLPLWQFTVIHRGTGRARHVHVDTAYGYRVEGRLHLVRDALEPPSIVEPAG